MYESKFHRVPIWTLSKGNRLALRLPLHGFSLCWKFDGFDEFHLGYRVVNVKNSDVRYLKPHRYVYLFF